MLNIIKADAKRILRSKSVWIMPILILMMTAMLSALFAGLNYVMSLDLSAVLGDSMDSLAAVGSIANTGYEMAIMNLQSDTLIYVMLVILLSVSAFDFSSGTIKNMLSIGKSRQQIYISKLVTSCIWTILGVFFYAFSSTLMGAIFFGFDVTGSQIVDIILITKDISSTVGAKATNRIHELEQQLLEQQELFRKQAELMQKQNEEFMAFKTI